MGVEDGKRGKALLGGMSMTEVAAATPAPEPPVTLEDLVAAHNGLLERNLAEMAILRRQVSAAIAGQGSLPELVMGWRRLADLEGVMLDIAGSVRKASALRSLHQMREAMAPPAAEPEPRHRHRRDKPRRDRSRRPYLRPVAAAVVLGAAATGGGIAAHDDASWHPVTAVLGPAVASAAQLPPDRAVLVPSAPLPHHRAGQDARSASPAPSPSASVPVSPAPPSPSQPAGTLAASTTTLNLGVLGAGSVTLTAEGGPVSWSASPVPGLEVWPSSGTLQDGQSVTVSFRALDQSQSGFAIVTLAPGVDVTVSWPAVAGLVPGALPSSALS